MSIDEGIRLVTQYVYDRKQVRVNLNAVYIMTDARQQELLKSAVKVAVEYYNGTMIVI